MTKIIKILICLLFSFSWCNAQINANDPILSKGIYLEDLGVLIPWEIDFSEITKYGSPKLSKDTDHWGSTSITWDSVTIFNNTILKLQAYRPNKFFKQSKIRHFNAFSGLIDSLTSQKLITFFNNYTHKEGYKMKGKSKALRWVIAPCFVYIWQDKKQNHHLHIENHGLTK